jgi:hypothetical protein
MCRVERISLANFSKDVLLNVEDDVLYRFYAGGS